MRILLCAATTFEVAPTLEFLQKNKSADTHLVDVLITGVGLLPASFHLTQQAALHRPQLIVQAGVAGSIDDRLSLGETVCVTEEFVGDSGVYQNGGFASLFDMALADSHMHPWTAGKLVNKNMDRLPLEGLKAVTGVTVNEITTHMERIHYYKQCGAQVESLEGAALHYVGLMMDIPFLQLRSVSNYAGERNKQHWRLKEAIANLNDTLQPIILKLLHI